jgi:L-ascorbate metabolism protein UlaG (beta-lactamase superfamily)
MQITKYKHACLSLEVDGKVLIVDPGILTDDLPALDNVAGVIVTHQHADHFDVAALGAIIGRNPDAVIYAHSVITRQFGDTLPHQSIEPGQTVTIGPFTVELFGGTHAVIHQSIPAVHNLGILINNYLYYPGDSFALPHRAIKHLALPVAAPWLKISESIEFLTEVSPEFAFPTHDAILSEAGKQIVDTLINEVCETQAIKYRRL